jgi:hypothetical protein
MASTGAEVTWKGQTAKTPKGKTRVDLKYTNGKEVTSYWGTSTEVGVKGPEDKSEEKLDEVKYKLKLGAKAAPAPAEPPTDSAPAEEPTDDLDFSTDDAGTEDQADTSSEPTSDDTATDDSGASDKPFDDEPFDAGVEADEESDPKKFIEQLTGKLGQSLRKYNEDQGEPDFELEKFAVNSLLSATHTGEMDAEDQKSIIKKVKTSGKGDGDEESADDSENTDDTETDDTDTETTDTETTDTETTDDGETTDTETTDTEETDDSENLFEDGESAPWADLWVQEGDIYYDKNRDCNYTVTKVDWKSNSIIFFVTWHRTRSENRKLNDNIFKSMIYEKEIVKVNELANPNTFEKLKDNTPMKTGWKAEFQRLSGEHGKKLGDITQKYKSGEIDQDEFEKSSMLAEMSLDDWKSKILIKIYDDNLEKGNTKILHILTRLVSFSDKINREEFLQDIQSEISDNEEMYYILDKLKNLGVDVDSYEEEVDYNRMFENAMILQNPKKNNMFQPGSNDVLDEYEIYEVVEEGKKKKKKTKKDACYHKVRARYDVWPSAYASGALVKCRKAGAANWGNSADESVDMEALKEKWSAKYKKSIDCNNPKGFSQKAHCQGRKK